MNWKLGKTQYSKNSTVTSAGTLTLTASSAQVQVFTGSTTHTMKLPDATTTSNGSGIMFTVVNESTGVITIQDNGSNTLTTVPAGSSCDFFLTSHASANGTWRIGQSTGTSGGGMASVAPGAAKTSDYTIVSGDKGKVINVDTTGGAVNITLPSPSAGFIVTIKDYAGYCYTNPVYIIRAGSENIDGNAIGLSLLAAYESVTLISDGTNWSRMGNFVGQQVQGTQKGLFGGGTTGTVQTKIDSIDIRTASNVSDFGFLATSRSQFAACGSQVRGLWGSGDTNGSEAYTTAVDDSVFATGVTTGSFATLTVARQMMASFSNNVRGFWAGGNNAGNRNEIDFVLVASGGAATDMGDLTLARNSLSGCSSSTRGVMAGGDDAPGLVNTMDYITLSATPTTNATTFGTLTGVRAYMGSCSSPILGLWGGGYNSGYARTTNIDQVTIATAGNATTFGTLTVARNDNSACSSWLRGVFGGGFTGSNSNVLDYVNFSTLGAATDFGDLSIAKTVLAACSNCHGGV